MPLLDAAGSVLLYGGVAEFRELLPNGQGPLYFNLHLATGNWSGMSHVYRFSDGSWEGVRCSRLTTLIIRRMATLQGRDRWDPP